MLVVVIVYPCIMFGLLNKIKNTTSENTFDISYEELRINRERLFYYLFRYFKLFGIALIIAVTYSSSPVIPLIILIFINLLDAIFIVALKPF